MLRCELADWSDLLLLWRYIRVSWLCPMRRTSLLALVPGYRACTSVVHHQKCDLHHPLYCPFPACVGNFGQLLQPNRSRGAADWLLLWPACTAMQELGFHAPLFCAGLFAHGLTLPRCVVMCCYVSAVAVPDPRAHWQLSVSGFAGCLGWMCLCCVWCCSARDFLLCIPPLEVSSQQPLWYEYLCIVTLLSVFCKPNLIVVLTQHALFDVAYLVEADCRPYLCMPFCRHAESVAARVTCGARH